MRSTSFNLRFLKSLIAIAAIAFAGRDAAFAAAPAATPTPGAVVEAKQSATARELVGALQKSIAGMVKAEQQPALANVMKGARGRAFNLALAQTAGKIDDLDQVLAADGKDLFNVMRLANSSVAALQVTYRYSSFDDDEFDEYFRKLVAGCQILRRNYGRDYAAAKTEAESALTPRQKTAFDNLKDRAIELVKQLREAEGGIKENPAIAFEFGALNREAARIDKGPADRSSLLDALTVSEIAAGRWNGLRLYVASVYPKQVKRLDPLDDFFAGFETVLKTATDAAYAGTGSAAFRQAAKYTEDIGIKGVADDEIKDLIKRAQAPKPAPSPAPAPDKDDAASLATDKQINEDDPDDDTSMDMTEEEENAKPADEGSQPGGNSPATSN